MELYNNEVYIIGVPFVRDERKEESMGNIIVISSAKAGSGKSFVSTNLATILALHGHKKNNGKGERPSVLLVEGDLQTLSVGTLFGVAESEYNLKNALKRISRIVDSQGNITGSPEEQRDVQDFIQDCCLVANEKIPNLAVVVSSEFSLAEREAVSPFHYYYLIKVLSLLFDIVIVDSNSAIEHKTTGPVLQEARDIYVVVTADYDGVRITEKTEPEYALLHVNEKVHYVLNKCLTRQQMSNSTETVEFNPEDYFDKSRIATKIPYIDQIVQYNSIYKHQPMVMHRIPQTLMARMAFTKLASNIWPMDNYDSLKAEVNALRKRK